MKTFETESLDIPVGATHYRNECNEFDFAWVKYTGDHTLMVDESITNWTEIDDRYFEAGVKPIRSAALENQMNIDNLATQTPEDKEALDLIDTTPHQYEASKFSGETEWKNGDECSFDNRTGVFIGLSKNPRLAVVEINNDQMPHDIDLVKICDLSKPETPQQREERERANGIYEMCASVDNFTEESNFWAGKFYDAGYRKESN